MTEQNNIDYEEATLFGIQYEYPKCVKCKYNSAGFCNYFNKTLNNVPTDIFKCPYFEEIKKRGMFGI